MQRPLAGTQGTAQGGILPALAVCSACFFLGGCLGCGLAARVSGAGLEGLVTYIHGFLDAAKDGGLAAPSLASVLWSCVRWPLLALLCGFSVLGLPGLPVLFSVRGFLLAFSIAAFVRVLGGTGCLLAFFLFGISGALSVPVLFLIGVQSFLSAGWRAAGSHQRGWPEAVGRAWIPRCAVCAALLAVCVMLEYLAVPALVSGLAGALWAA